MKLRWIVVLLVVGVLFYLAIGGRASAELKTSLPLVLQKYSQTPGSITGRVFDSTSVTRAALADVQVCVAGACDATDVEGVYLLENIPDGLLKVSASATDFHTLTESVLVKPNEATHQDFALTPFSELTDVFMRIVLTWDPTSSWPPDSTPNDLDAHMWLEAPDPPTHVSFDARGDCTTFPNTCLEVDYQYGFGPETMAIRQLENTVYYYGILNYYADYPGVPEITQSNAKVRIYQENGVTYEYSVPKTGEGDFWYIFSIETDGATATIIEKNCITTYDEGIPACPGEQLKERNTTLRPLK
jgi:hypothetical protein